MRKVILAVALLCLPIIAAAVTSPMPYVKIQFLDNSGAPCAGCSLYSYSAGTSTPLATYTDSSGLSQNTNPIVLDSAGRANIWLGTNSYKFVLKDANGVTLWTVDNVTNNTLVTQNNTWSGTQTFSGAVTFNSTVAMNSTTTAKQINSVRYVDQYCTSPGVYNETCWNNAISNLPSSGGIVQDTSCRDYTINSSVNVTKSGVHLKGCGTGAASSGGTRLLAANGTVTPIVNWAGPSSIISNGSMDGIRIEGVYTATQKCAYFNYFNHVDVSRVQYFNCGIGMDIDYGFLLRITDSDFANCGSGDTAATACTRVENRSNPSVATEQVWFNHNTWGCDQVTRTNQGMAVYLGPNTNQSYIRGSKFDYTSCSFAPRVIALYQTQQNLIQDNSIAVGSSSFPSTASALIDVNGTAGTTSQKNNIQNNYLLFWTSTPAVKIDYGTNNIVSGNNLEGSGTGTAITLTANSGGNQTGPNWLITADTYLSNSSTTNIAASEKIDSTYAWWFRDRIAVGNNAASSGGISLPNNVAIAARNAANSADINLIYLDASNNILFGAQGIFQTAVSAPEVIANGGGVLPQTAGSGSVGSATLPFQSLNIGSAANVYSSLSTTATTNRSAILPDASGNITLKSAASANHAVCWKTNDTLGYCSDTVAAGGTCTCN